MNRAIKIIEMIIDEFLPDDFNKLVSDFFVTEFITTIEGEIIIHPQFMKLLKIVGYGYYEDASLYIKNNIDISKISKDIVDNQAKIVLATKYDLNISTIELTNLLLYFINMYCGSRKNIQPYEFLNRMVSKDIIKLRKTVKSVIKYYLNLSSIKYEIIIDNADIIFISLISKKSVNEISEQIINNYIDIEELNKNGRKSTLFKM